MKDVRTQNELEYVPKMEQHLQHLARRVPLSYLPNNFAKYVRRQELTRFLVRHELFKKLLDVKGSILECGVFSGNGLMTWAHLSAILEPVAFWRQIYGFDTFAGFPSIASQDRLGERSANPNVSDVKDESYEDLQTCIDLFDLNRFLAQFPKVHLIKGDFMVTGEKFLKENPHLLIALLYLDFDLYEPTKKALELFLPRMPKGAVLGFDEINNPYWPGETLALLESLDVRKLTIHKFPYEPHMAYIVL